MSEANATIADIARYMRSEFPERPPRKVWSNHARDVLCEYADRIEAAWRRERGEAEARAVEHTEAHMDAVHRDDCRDCVRRDGNAAAMREALESVQKSRRGCYPIQGVLDPLTIHLVEKALAAPPRNCDRFARELDAQIAFLNEVWLISVDEKSLLDSDKFENWTDEMKVAYAKWLLAPATEKGGER